MNIAIEKGTKIALGKHTGEIQQHFLETGKLLIALDNGNIITKSWKWLMKQYDEGLVKFGEIPKKIDAKTKAEKAVYIDIRLTDEQRKLINRKKDYVESCLLNGKLLDVDDCDIRIREHALRSDDKRCPRAKTVRKWAHRYIAKNCDPRALLENRSLMGNHKSKLPEAAKTLMSTVVKTEYLRPNGSTIKQTWAVLNHHLEKHPEKYGVASISYKTVRAHIEKIDAFQKMSKRQGYKKAINEFPSGFDKQVYEYLLERVEFDQTQLNIYLVDPDTDEVIGRPWLTMGVDVTSAMIVWFHLSMERLDGNTLPRILYMAMCPKDMDHLRKQYPELKSDWPVQGVIQEIVLDNSMENHTHDFQTACTDILNTILHYVPPAQGSLKPHIERLFGHVKTAFTPLFDGSYTKDDTEKHALRHAVLTMEELTKFFTIWVVDKYHNEYQERLRMTPLEKWRHCIELHGTTRLPGCVLDLQRLQWRSETATLQKYGMQFEMLKFNSPALMAFARRSGFKKSYAFYYNPFNLASIFVIDPVTDELIEVQNTLPEYRQNEVTHEEHKKVRQIINSEKRLTAMDPNSAVKAAFDLLHGAAVDSRKRANAKIRKAKARKNTPTSDQLMNGTTKKSKPKKATAQNHASWL